MFKPMLQRLLLLALFVPCGPAWADSSEIDPWEGFNRQIFAFNDFLDRNLLLPVTRGYVAWVPGPVRTGVHNFLGNLDDVVSLFSNALQLKPRNTAQDFGRVVGNTVFGLLGLLDVATPLGIPKQHEDIGQVLGYWGAPSGPYLVLPLIGPSNIRDGLAIIPNGLLSPAVAIEPEYLYWNLQAVSIIDTRAGLIKSEGLLSGDRYGFIRDAYMQRRAFLVNDGMATDSFKDDGF
tara:strand:+ start:289 stop:990 length:702 start_codon:yes stop_codon:yes gene_type:complete